MINQVGRYKIDELLKRGGMGEVYRAYDPELDRTVVVKVVAPSSADAGWEDRERFRHEVQAASRLNHPHIVRIYDVDLKHDPPYVVMELLEGGSLQERFRQNRFAWPEALHLARLLAQALAYAHGAGIIHRDVKPANVMFAGPELDSLKLVDFGLAKRQDGAALTQAGAVMGTVAYMSPEQARGETVDRQTDIFALGIVLYEAIAGRNPLYKGSVASTLAGVASDEPVDLSPLPGRAPREVIRLVERAVAKDRSRRYATCEAFLVDLDLCQQQPAGDDVTLAPIAPNLPPPELQVGANINLPPESEAVLKLMFAGFRRVAVEAELGGGFSGSRIFQVRLVEQGGKPYLPAAVKIAPAGLIRAEWEAYRRLVENVLPNVAPMVAPPVFPPPGLYGGLSYRLVGGGIFPVVSLADYSRSASTEHLCWVLQERLFKSAGAGWWLASEAAPAFQMQLDYDRLLPTNFRVRFMSPPQPGLARLVETGAQLPLSLKVGEPVIFQGWVVDKINLDERWLTLNLPPAAPDRPAPSYRIRLEEVPDITRYKTGQRLEVVGGEVTTTRHDLLLKLAGRALGPTDDLAAGRLSLAPGVNLPNPLLAYPRLLREFLMVRLSTVHADLNLNNILVDPATRDVSLIDFATVRRGHVLHDLLRLETEVLIKLIPQVLLDGELPVVTLHSFYRQLHQATLDPARAVNARLPHPELEKLFELVLTIRRMARKCLYDADNWREYYQGLVLYCLGALKFTSLWSWPPPRLAGQALFWGAAIAQDLLETNQVEARPGRPAVIFTPDPPLPVKVEPPYGTMALESELYIERAADPDCAAQFTRPYAVTLSIQAPRQMGKSSLLNRAVRLAGRDQGRAFVFVDFQQFPESYFDDEDKFLINFCLLIGEGLDLPEAIDRYWQDRHTGIAKCSRYLSRYIIPQLDRPLILALDEVERMLTSPFRANFFGMLRTWHNGRVHDENLARLSLFLSSSTDPYLFIDNPNQSPFNVAEAISLQDFTRPEVDELNQRHGSPLRPGQVDELVAWVGGHPFLTRLALYLVATGRFTPEALWRQATDDNGPFGEHLRHYLLRVLLQPELKQALAQICRDHVYEENRLFYRLKGAGLVKKAGREIVLRNQLYTHYFEEHLNV